MSVRASLVAVKSDGSTKEVAITSPRLVVGRDSECQIRIPVADVSRRHCELLIGGDRVALRDLGSSNGSFVNGERVSESQLSAGDVVGVGPCLFVVRLDGSPEDIDGQALWAQHQDQDAPAASASEASDEFGNLQPLDLDGSSEMDFDFNLDDDEDDEQPAL